MFCECKQTLDDDNEMRRYTNKSSLTNKNETGYHFTHTNKYTFPSTPANMNLAVNEEPHRDTTVTTTMAARDDENVSRLNAATPVNKSHEFIRNTAANSVLSTYEQNRASVVPQTTQEMNRNSVLSIHASSTYGTCEVVNTNHNHNRITNHFQLNNNNNYNNNNNNGNSWRKHAIEAGINLNMPGQSEHQYRYTKPIKQNYKNFVLNPQQDSRLLKRPFLLADYDAITTEYRQRFLFPDKNKIDKFPWIKQI